MTIVRQLMRGSTAQADAVTSVVGHLVMDTTRKDLRLYDGVLLGGYIIPTKTTLGTDTGINVYGSQRLGGQLPAFYQNASNLNAGTLPNARLAGDYSFANLTLSARLTAASARLTGTTGASDSSTTHAFQVGADAGDNTRIGGNILAFVSNGAYAPGRIRAGTYLYVEAPALIVGGSEIRFGSTSTNDSILFEDSVNTYYFLADGNYYTAVLDARGYQNAYLSILDAEFRSDSGSWVLGNTPGFRMNNTGVLHIACDSSSSVAVNRYGTAGAAQIFRFENITTGNVSVNTGICTFNQVSDKRKKTDLQPIDLSLLDQIQVFDFEWIDHPGHRSHGLMAQDNEGLIPGLVTHSVDSDIDDDGNSVEVEYWFADYSKLTPLHHAVLQQHKSRITELETKLAALESKLEALING